MMDALREHRSGYLSTAAGLGLFTVSACLFSALRLRSANDGYPRGLANSWDVGGRHDMGHTEGVLPALSRCAAPTAFQKTLARNDFSFGDGDRDDPLGHIAWVRKAGAAALSAEPPSRREGSRTSWPGTPSIAG